MIKEDILQQINTIKDGVNNLDQLELTELYTHILSTIKEGNRIYLITIGKNVGVGEKFIKTLKSLGIKASFLHAEEALHGDIGEISKNDFGLLLSKSGNTPSLCEVIRILNNRKIKFGLITSNVNSTCAINSDMVLHACVLDEGDEWNLVPHNSVVLFLFILNAVTLALINDLDIKKDDFLSSHPGGGIGLRI